MINPRVSSQKSRRDRSSDSQRHWILPNGTEKEGQRVDLHPTRDGQRRQHTARRAVVMRLARQPKRAHRDEALLVAPQLEGHSNSTTSAELHHSSGRTSVRCQHLQDACQVYTSSAVTHMRLAHAADILGVVGTRHFA